MAHLHPVRQIVIALLGGTVFAASPLVLLGHQSLHTSIAQAHGGGGGGEGGGGGGGGGWWRR